MTDKTSFVSSKRSKARRTKRRTRQNLTKLDQTRPRRQRRTNKTKLHGSCTSPRPHCIPYLNLVIKNKDTDAHTSVNPGGLAVHLGTITAVGERDKAQEARLASLGTGSSPFICFGEKTFNNSNQGPSGPPLKFKA